MKRNSRRLLGIAILMLALVIMLATPARGQTNFTVLKSFSGTTNLGGFPDGALPMSSLVTDSDGVLYGTTETGGVTNAGTVFRINKDGTGFRRLKSFLVSDGASPFASLLLSTNGALFGTTRNGGSSKFGTVFKINRDGSGFSVLHNFLGSDDGMNPQNALVQASDGALYGVTPNGNATSQGTIYKINPDGTGYSVIFGFPGSAAGAQPYCRLLEGSDGELYGTASAGGTAGAGVIFGITKDAGVYNILWDFKGFDDGAIPRAGLIEASDQVLYGTTYSGGTGNGGTVYKISKDGSGHGIVRSFSTTGGDAAGPQSEIIESADGTLYGGTQAGGSGSYGAIFKVNKDGSGYGILHSFLGPGVDGDTPSSVLDLGNGVFCGTTVHGAGNAGSVFALTSVPLPPRILSESLSGTSNRLQLALSVGTPYDLQRSTNLAAWQVLATIISSSNGSYAFSDTNPPKPTAFYRLHQQ